MKRFYNIHFVHFFYKKKQMRAARIEKNQFKSNILAFCFLQFADNNQ